MWTFQTIRIAKTLPFYSISWELKRLIVFSLPPAPRQNGMWKKNEKFALRISFETPENQRRWIPIWVKWFHAAPSIVKWIIAMEKVSWYQRSWSFKTNYCSLSSGACALHVMFTRSFFLSIICFWLYSFECFENPVLWCTHYYLRAWTSYFVAAQHTKAGSIEPFWLLSIFDSFHGFE